MNENETIPLGECQDRRVYRLRSRNLTVGVFDAERKGFIGIRTKLGSRYLFMEYHVDTGPPFGTATPFELLETAVDSRILLRETLRSACAYCGLPVVWMGSVLPDGSIAGPAPWGHGLSKDAIGMMSGGGGEHVIIYPTECNEPSPVARENTPLFHVLDEIESEGVTRPDLSPLREAVERLRHAYGAGGDPREAELSVLDAAEALFHEDTE